MCGIHLNFVCLNSPRICCLIQSVLQCEYYSIPSISIRSPPESRIRCQIKKYPTSPTYPSSFSPHPPSFSSSPSFLSTYAYLLTDGHSFREQTVHAKDIPQHGLCVELFCCQHILHVDDCNAYYLSRHHMCSIVA